MTKSHVYVLYSLKDNKTYLGSTSDIDRRLVEHEKGYVRATKNRRPLKLIYTEPFDTIQDARKQERFYKTAWGRRKLKVFIDPIIKKYGPVV